ncbi:MAG TPA: sugar phosphate isomerase/epimerase family protein, partial [Terriglobia bacterium]|nr:sugar phosphate isomerase/epimerase family protein [Terriglobia bacterium]
YPIDKVIDNAARLGFDGVEILHVQLEDETTARLNGYKRQALANSLDLISLTIHQDFVFPEAADRKKMIDHTLHCIDLAYELGTPAIRLNSGRWKTIKTFEDLMKADGKEPILPGYTEDDGFKWCIDSIQQCLPAAEKAGVVLAMENHWGLSGTVDGVLRILKGVNSPWFGVTLDIGNLMGDPYPQIERLAPHARLVHFKTYFGGGVWYTHEIDYRRVANILAQANYHGYVDLEMEGKEDAETAVPKSLEVMRKAFA